MIVSEDKLPFKNMQQAQQSHVSVNETNLHLWQKDEAVVVDAECV